MRLSLLLTLILPFAILSTPAFAQEYWDYAPLEGEWEEHHPTEGLEYEHERDYYTDGYDLSDVEREQYEWEAGEGYHEQEWYDPSDWFETGSDMDYENGYYDDYDYEYYDDDAYYGDYYTEDAWYEWEYEPAEDEWEYESVYE